MILAVLHEHCLDDNGVPLEFLKCPLQGLWVFCLFLFCFLARYF